MRPLPAVTLFGYSIVRGGFSDVLNTVLSLKETGQFKRVVTLNPEIIMGSKGDQEMASWIRSSDLIFSDGLGVCIASLAISSIRLTKVRGVDLAIALLKEPGLTFYFIGGTKAVVEKAVMSDTYCHSQSQVVGWHHGYVAPAEWGAIIGEIKALSPDFIFVCMGFPKQEQFIQRLAREISQGVAIGLGGTLDVLSGHVSSAPKIVQKIGLEWLYRMVNDPKRFRRLPILGCYIGYVIRQVIKKYI